MLLFNILFGLMPTLSISHVGTDSTEWNSKKRGVAGMPENAQIRLYVYTYTRIYVSADIFALSLSRGVLEEIRGGRRAGLSYYH